MTERKKIKNLWSKLLIIVLICIVGLGVLLGTLLFRQSRHLDLSYAYTPSDMLSSEYTYGAGAASKHVVSAAAVVLDDVTLNSTSERALLFNVDSNTPLFAQGIYNRVYPASITKLMTALLIVKYGNLEDTVVMEESDFQLEEGSQVSGMIPGDTLTMEQLFRSIVVYSANDSAMAAARHLCGDVDGFVNLMNEEAQRLGMISTHFTNPHGLHDPDHYTSAYDVYILLNEAMKYPAFTDAVNLSFYTLKVTRSDGNIISYRLDATDKYVTGEKQLPYGVTLLGGKTGTTPEAGACLCVYVQNEKGVPFIAVVLNAYNRTVLYEDMNKLLSHINDANASN